MKYINAATIILLLAAVTVFAGSENSFLKAGEYLAQGKSEEAVKLYEKFTTANPEHRLAPTAIFNSASIYQNEIGDFKKAEDSYKRLIEGYPKTKWRVEAYRRLGDIYIEEGKAETAFDYYVKSLKCSGDYGMDSQYWTTGLIEACRSCVEKSEDSGFKMKGFSVLASVSPAGEAEAQCQFHYATSLLENEMRRKASGEFHTLISEYPINEWGARAAEEQRELITEYYPEFDWGTMDQFLQIRGLAQQNSHEELDKLLEEIRQTTSNKGWLISAEFAILVNDVYLTGDFDTGLMKLQDFIDDNPKWKNDPQVQNFEEVWSEILQLLDRIKSEPNDSGTHEQLGFTLLRHRFNDLSEKHFKKAVENPEAVNAYLGLGYVYLRTNRLEEAVENFEVYLKDNLDDGNTLNRVGYAYLQIGRLEDALRCFGFYVEAEPNNPNSHDSYAECLMNLERYDEAIAEYNKALELNPAWANAVYMLGEIARRQGDIKKALEFYEKYLAMEPNGRLSGQAHEAIASIKEIENN